MAQHIFPRPVAWIGSSKKDFSAFPDEVQAEMGYALYLAQTGERHHKTKMLTGLHPSVIEILESYRGDTYRTIYTVKFSSVIFVLHAFQKKSTQGIKTPLPDIRLIGERLKRAQMDYESGK